MNNLKNSRILVTGGAGFIGSHLVDALFKEGCYLRVFDNLTNGKKKNLDQHISNQKYEFIKGDITNSKQVSKALINVDIVFHLACLGVRHSISHPFENHLVNTEGTLIVLDQAHKKKVKKFIHCSSSEVYGTAEKVPMSESHPTYPCTIYGASKLAGEAYARAYYLTYGLNTVIVRPFNTYGPRSHYEGFSGEFIPRSIVRALQGKNIIIYGDGTQTRDFTYVTDIVNAFVKIAKNDKLIGKTVNIGSSDEISIIKVANIIINKVGNKLVKIERLKSRPGDVFRLFADASTLGKITRWKPNVSFNSGLELTIKWFRKNVENIKKLNNIKNVNW